MGRFAPTPSGELHLGSLYAAAASYLDARAHGGRWLVRIEDLDGPREVPGAADRILRTLEAFGFEWDGAVVRQSERTPLYAAAVQKLQDHGLTFSCSCSRAQIEAERRYPGTCRERRLVEANCALRLRVGPSTVELFDDIQGRHAEDVAEAAGDFIIRRRDGIYSYVLAVVVDDAEQGITRVLRGADLLDDTPRQIYLQRALGLPQPRYAHVPVLTAADGGKLAKSRRSSSLDSETPLRQLMAVFSRLGLPAARPRDLVDITDAWRWAIEHFDVYKVPKCRKLRIDC